MTCRERLASDHPLFVNSSYDGGCKDCPSEYGYLPDPEYCEEGPSPSVCSRCWNRVMTDNDNFTTWRDFRKACERCVYSSKEGYLCYREGHFKPVACTYAYCPRKPNPFSMEDADNKKETETSMTNTKKTKAQLIEELKEATERAATLEADIKNLEKYKQYDDAASEIRAMYDAFINVGFTETQAYDMLKMSMQMDMANSTFDHLKKAVRR